MDDSDLKFLKRAVEISHTQVLAGNGGPFGAIVVMDGHIIAEGANAVTLSNDPTAHAEIIAIRRACEALGTFRLAGATMYSSCEPCPMCLAAIYWARLDRLAFANTRVQAADIGFDDAAIYDEILKAISKRSIPTLHLPLPEGIAAFRAWAAKPDKIEY